MRGSRLFGRLCALTLALTGGVAQAQAYQCRIPQAPVSVPRVEPDGASRRVPITGYTLALSWSPEYCRTRKNRSADALQCSGKNGRFGLILHGFWPEGSGGNWPQWCPTTRNPAPKDVREHLCMTPSARLLAHEWAKHGSCMVRKPETYFKINQILWDSLQMPDLDRLSRRDGLNAGNIREAFHTANPGIKTSAIGIDLNKRGWLEEIRVCYGKDYRPTRCSPARFGARDSVKASIWRGL